MVVTAELPSVDAKKDGDLRESAERQYTQPMPPLPELIKLPKAPAAFLLEYTPSCRGALLISEANEKSALGDMLHNCHLVAWSRIDGDRNAFFRRCSLENVIIIGADGKGYREFHFKDKKSWDAIASPLSSFPACCEVSKEEYDKAVSLIYRQGVDSAVAIFRGFILERDREKCKDRKVPIFYKNPLISDEKYLLRVDVGGLDCVRLIMRDGEDRYHDITFTFNTKRKAYTISDKHPFITEVEIKGDLKGDAEVKVKEGDSESKTYERKRVGIGWNYLAGEEKSKAKEEIEDAINSLERILSHIKVWGELNYFGENPKTYKT